MKVNLKTAINGVANKIQKIKIDKKEAHIRSLVKLDDVKNANVHHTLYNAREVLANYAKSKGITIGFNTTSYHQGDDMLGIIVEKAGKPTKLLAREIPIGESTYKKVVSLPIENNETGVEHFRDFVYEYQDSFLRGVYRKIEGLVKELKN